MIEKNTQPKKYLLFVSLPYAFPVLRPVQDAIRQRENCEVAWFVEEPYAHYLKNDERRLRSVAEVMDYNPMAVLVVDNKVYDFFPGIKVQLFHGFNIHKRISPSYNGHFNIRGLFDLYCTQGENTTPEFERLSNLKGHFKAYETGWPKIDALFKDYPNEEVVLKPSSRPCILYTSTFTKGITSTPYLYDEIKRLITSREWDWLITFHPKMDRETVEKYKQLAQYDNVIFYEGDNNIPLLKRADVMICDSSSIIIEFQMQNKPVVTFKNTHPGDYLIDIDDPDLLEQSIEKALSPSEELLRSIRKNSDILNPYRDGKSSERVLDAIDWFLENHYGKLKRKPLNLVRKLQLRWKLKYFHF